MTDPEHAPSPAPVPMRRPRVVVLGDLVVDVVLAPSGPLRHGTDVAGRVAFRQGGSAATTARWLAARGLDATLVTAVGDDGAGDALESYLRARDVCVRAVRIPGSTTGRLGVLLDADGERSFVGDRGAILRLAPRLVRAAWFRRLDLVHLPLYSLVGGRLAATSARAVEIARRDGALVSIDLASAGLFASEGPDLVVGRVAGLHPDVLLATRDEEQAARDGGVATLLDLAPVVVVKEGASGAGGRTRDGVSARVAVRRARVRDTTGAGDAFDAGFLASLLGLADPRHPDGRGLRQALAAGTRAAARELLDPRVEFVLEGLSAPPA